MTVVYTHRKSQYYYLEYLSYLSCPRKEALELAYLTVQGGFGLECLLFSIPAKRENGQLTDRSICNLTDLLPVICRTTPATLIVICILRLFFLSTMSEQGLEQRLSTEEDNDDPKRLDLGYFYQNKTRSIVTYLRP